MSITYEWDITSMECLPEANGKTNVVVQVGWTLTASDTVRDVMTTGMLELTYDESSDFVEFSTLTKEQVISWVQQSLGENHVAGLEGSLANDIAKLSNSRVEMSLPWQSA